MRTRPRLPLPRRAPAGFSLVELLILVVAALVVAGLSVPVLRGIRLASNSESALTTLASLRDAQIAHKEQRRSHNAAGAPRFARLGELFGSDGKPPVGLEESAPVGGGRFLRRHGYLFGAWFVTRDHKLVEDPAHRDAFDGKQAFVLYAWPEEYGVSGSSAFALDPHGELRTPPATGALESKNLLHRYSGLDRVPSPDAAKGLPASTSATAAARTLDGDLWEVVSFPP